MFDEVAGGQRFIDPGSNQLCRKLNERYLSLSQMVVHQPENGAGKMVLNDVNHYNAIVESTGDLIPIPYDRQVQVFV